MRAWKLRTPSQPPRPAQQRERRLQHLGLLLQPREDDDPVAAFFLHRWGPIKGMLFFKLSIVVFVCLIAQVIAQRRMETARMLLRVGTLAVACIVMYSAMLYLRHT